MDWIISVVLFAKILSMRMNRKGYKKEMAANSEFRIWVNILSSLAMVPLSIFGEALIIAIITILLDPLTI